VQFVDFSAKLLSRTPSIYRSTSGAAEATEEWTRLTTHLQQLCDQLSAVPVRVDPSTGLPSPEDAALRGLARECRDAGDKLLGALEKLTSKKGQSKSKWRSFRVALATAWNENDINAMAQRLESYQSLLALHLIRQVGAADR
jgi:hypothetical protein